MEVRRTIDNSAKLMERMNALTGQEVLVGIPQSTTERQDGKMTNASIAYIHEFGSPAHNIPERSFMRPGVRNVRDQIAATMRQGAQDVLHGDAGAAAKTLGRVGMLARNSVVRAINYPNPAFAPLAPATIRARLWRTQAGRRRLQQIMAGGRQMGMSSAETLNAYARSTWDTGGTGNLNIRPLIDTTQLRSAITYVIRPAPASFTWFGYQRDYGRIVTTPRR